MKIKENHQMKKMFLSVPSSKKQLKELHELSSCNLRSTYLLSVVLHVAVLVVSLSILVEVLAEQSDWRFLDRKLRGRRSQSDQRQEHNLQHKTTPSGGLEQHSQEEQDNIARNNRLKNV